MDDQDFAGCRCTGSSSQVQIWCVGGENAQLSSLLRFRQGDFVCSSPHFWLNILWGISAHPLLLNSMTFNRVANLTLSFLCLSHLAGIVYSRRPILSIGQIWGSYLGRDPVTVLPGLRLALPALTGGESTPTPLAAVLDLWLCLVAWAPAATLLDRGSCSGPQGGHHVAPDSSLFPSWYPITRQ